MISLLLAASLSMQDLDKALQDQAMSNLEISKTYEMQYVGASAIRRVHCTMAREATAGAFELKKIKLEATVYISDPDIMARASGVFQYRLSPSELPRVDRAILNAEAAAAYYQSLCEHP